MEKIICLDIFSLIENIKCLLLITLIVHVFLIMDVEFLRYKYEDAHDGVVTKMEFRFGVRHIQMVYMILSSLVLGMMRSSNTIAVLAVTDNMRTNETYIQIHNWDSRIQGTILSSFFFGYAVTLAPAAIYLKRGGDKLILTAIFLINGALSSAMPTIINKGGWIAACNAQLLMGMTQACLSPVNYSLMSNWFLPNERKLFSTLIHSAILLGTIIAFPLSGLLTEARLGWELVFYSQAMVVLSMAAILVLLTASNPDKHEAVGDTEKDTIKQAKACYRERRLIKPWRQIINSWSFWALASAHAAANAVFIFFLSEIPSFLLSLNLSLKTIGLQAALPFAAMWAVYITTAPASDWVYRIFGYFEVKHYRKILNSMGALGVIIGLAILPHLSPNWSQLIVMILIGILGLIGLQFSAFLENHQDLTENFAGTLLMMTSVVASVVGAAVPFICGLIIGGDVTIYKRWKIIFSAMACFYFACNMVYFAFSSSDRQQWDSSSRLKIGYNNDAANLELDEISRTNKPHLNTEAEIAL